MSDKTLSDKSGTVIVRCNCASPYQDKKYGDGLRVFNLCAKKERGQARCSVCGRYV